MGDDPVNLGAVRAAKEQDSRKWTVSECLEHAASLSRDGRWSKCVVILHRPDANGAFSTDLRIAGCTTLEVRGLLFNAVKDEIAEDTCP